MLRTNSMFVVMTLYSVFFFGFAILTQSSCAETTSDETTIESAPRYAGEAEIAPQNNPPFRQKLRLHESDINALQISLDYLERNNFRLSAYESLSLSESDSSIVVALEIDFTKRLVAKGDLLPPNIVLTISKKSGKIVADHQCDGICN
jgi:hypothetical protein